jgi:ribA/ribD-fused uncharacterized protein
MTLLPEDIIALKKRSNTEEFEYLYFWRAVSDPGGRIGVGCFSQWWPAPFSIGEQEFPTAEHFMMHSKAVLFEDMERADEILNTESCEEVKRIGGEVENFDEQLWTEHRFAVVLRGNLAKFSQNQPLKEYIMSTTEKIIVEASPVDPVWGIGLSEEEARKTPPSEWKGLNLLGFALMRTRSLLECGQEYVSEFLNVGSPGFPPASGS